MVKLKFYSMKIVFDLTFLKACFGVISKVTKLKSNFNLTMFGLMGLCGITGF